MWTFLLEHWTTTCHNLLLCCSMCATVVFYCHAVYRVMGQFLFRAQHHNMTNGDFAFFSLWPQKYTLTDTPWKLFDPTEQHGRQAYRVLKWVCANYSPPLVKMLSQYFFIARVSNGRSSITITITFYCHYVVITF